MDFLSAGFWALGAAGLLVWRGIGRERPASVLLIISLVLYWAQERSRVDSDAGLVLLMCCIVGTWMAGKSAGKWAGRLLVIGLLGSLAWFKYRRFLGFGDAEGLILGGLFLPLGLSFYVFQASSYLIDRSRSNVVAEPRLGRLGGYIAFFPQLVAGPIVMAREFLPQFARRAGFLSVNVRGALGLILAGLFKKAVLADSMAPITDRIMATETPEAGVAWLFVVAYALRIYFDFSGYSDIAIGLARLFGFRLPTNFRFPYSARSFQEFWRRWHITLSRWLRDYVYITFGGSRRGPGRMYFALFATMALGGLWHGAHWNFVIWGCAHGILLAAERPLLEHLLRSGWIRTAYGWFVRASVGILWIPFATGSHESGGEGAWRLFAALWRLDGWHAPEHELQIVVVCLLGLVVFARFGKALTRAFYRLPVSMQAGFAAILLLWVVLVARGADFIYFVF